MKRYLVASLITLLLGLLLTDWWAAKAVLRARDAQEAYDPTLQDMGGDRYQILARRLRSARAIADSLEETNADLARDLRRARIQSVTTITVQAPPETLHTVRTDTVHGRPGIPPARAALPVRAARLDPERRLGDRGRGGARLPPVNLLNLISRRRDRTWWADVQVEPLRGRGAPNPGSGSGAHLVGAKPAVGVCRGRRRRLGVGADRGDRLPAAGRGGPGGGGAELVVDRP